MPSPIELEVTIRITVERDLYDGRDDDGIRLKMATDTNEIRNRPWDAVSVRVVEPLEKEAEE